MLSQPDNKNNQNDSKNKSQKVKSIIINKKYKKQYLDNKYISLLYDNPEEFFQENNLNTLLTAPLFLDITNTSLFEHYYIAKTINKNNNIYENNETLFFETFKKKLETTLSLSNNTFLHYLANTKHDIEMIIKLIEYDCISDELISIKSKSDYFYSEILKCISLKPNLLNKEQCLNLFNLILTKFPSFNKVMPLEDKINMCFFLYANNSLNSNNMIKEPTILLDVVKTFPEDICPQFINKFLYLEEIDFNFLDLLIQRGLWNEAKEIISYLQSSITEKSKDNLWIISHLYHFVGSVDLSTDFDKTKEYVNCIIDCVKSISVGDSNFWSIKLRGKNIFHWLFSNKTASKSIFYLKRLYENIISLFLYKDEKYANKLLSKKDSGSKYWYIPSLYLLNRYENKIDETFVDFWKRISEPFKLKKLLFKDNAINIINNYIKTNQPDKLKLFYNYFELSCNEKNHISNIMNSISKTYILTDESHLQLFSLLLDICKNIYDNNSDIESSYLYLERFLDRNYFFCKYVNLFIDDIILNSKNIIKLSASMFVKALNNSFSDDEIEKIYCSIFEHYTKDNILEFHAEIINRLLYNKKSYRLLNLIKKHIKNLDNLFASTNIDESIQQITSFFGAHDLNNTIILDILLTLMFSPEIQRDKFFIQKILIEFGNNKYLTFISYMLFLNYCHKEEKEKVFDFLSNAGAFGSKKELIQNTINSYWEQETKDNVIESEQIKELNSKLSKLVFENWTKIICSFRKSKLAEFCLMFNFLIYLENVKEHSKFNVLFTNILSNSNIVNVSDESIDINMAKIKLLNGLTSFKLKNQKVSLDFKRLNSLIINEQNKMKSTLLNTRNNNFGNNTIISDKNTITKLLKNNLVCEHLFKVINKQEDQSLISLLLFKDLSSELYMNLYFWYLPPKVLNCLYAYKLENILFGESLNINPFLFLLNKNTLNNISNYSNWFNIIFQLNSSIKDDDGSRYKHEFPKKFQYYFPYEVKTKQNRFFKNSKEFAKSIGIDKINSFLKQHPSFREAFCDLLSFFLFTKKKIYILITKYFPSLFTGLNKCKKAYTLFLELLPFMIKGNLLSIPIVEPAIISITDINNINNVFEKVTQLIILYSPKETKKEFFQLFIKITKNMNKSEINNESKYLILLYSIFTDDLNLFIQLKEAFQINTQEDLISLLKFIPSDSQIKIKSLSQNFKYTKFVSYIIKNRNLLLIRIMIITLAFNILKYCLASLDKLSLDINKFCFAVFIPSILSKSYENMKDISNENVHENSQYEEFIGNNLLIGKYFLRKYKNSSRSIYYILDYKKKYTIIYDIPFPFSTEIIYYHSPFYGKLEIDGPFYSNINPFYYLFDADYSIKKDFFYNNLANIVNSSFILNLKTCREMIKLNFRTYFNSDSIYQEMNIPLKINYSQIKYFLNNCLDMINALGKETFKNKLSENNILNESFCFILETISKELTIYFKKDTSCLQLLIKVVSQLYPCLFLKSQNDIKHLIIIILISFDELVKLCEFNLEEVLLYQLKFIFNEGISVNWFLIHLLNSLLESSTTNGLDTFIGFIIKWLQIKNSSKNKNSSEIVNKNDNLILEILHVVFWKNQMIQFIFLCFSVYKININYFSFLLDNCNQISFPDHFNDISIKNFLKNNYIWAIIQKGRNDFTRTLQKKSFLSLFEFAVISEYKIIMNYYLSFGHLLTRYNISDKLITQILKSGNISLYNQFKSVLFPLKERHIPLFLSFCCKSKDNSLMNEAKQLMNLSPSDLFYYALIGNCSNDFITKCYNDMEEKDKITLLRNIDTCEATIKNSNEYQYNSSLYISESTFNLSNDDNYNQLFEILVKTNNYQILSDLLHLFKRNNINVLLPTFYCSMKISDYKCFMYLINEDLFYRLEPNDKNKIINILPINEFYIWLKDNKTFCDDLSDKVKIRIEAFIITYDIFYKGLSFFNKGISYNETKTIINLFLMYIFMYDNNDSVNNLLAPFLKFKNKRLFTSIVFFLFTKLSIPFNSKDIISIFKKPLFIDEDYAIILICIYEEINHIDFLKLKRFSYVNNYIKENVLPDIWNVNEIELHSKIENNNNNEENDPNSLTDLFSKDLETNPFSFWKSLNTLMIIEKNSFKLNEEIIENIKTNNSALTKILLSEKMNILNLFTKIPPSNHSILDIKTGNENTKIPFINSLNDINWLPEEENKVTKLVQVLKELEFIYSEFSFLWKTNPILNEYFLCFKKQEFEMLFNYLNDELIEGIKKILPEIVYIVFGKETSSSTEQTITFANQSDEARRNILQQFQELFTSNTSTDENPIKKYKNNLTFIINSFLAFKDIYLRTEFSFIISERFKFIFEYEENPEKAKSMITKSFCLICHFYFQDEEDSNELETKCSLLFPFTFHNNNVSCPIEPSTKTPIENILQQIPIILNKFSTHFIRDGYYVYKQLIIKFCEYHLNLGENDNEIYLPNNNKKNENKSESVNNDIPCHLNEVEFIEFIKYLYFSKNVNPLLSSQKDDTYYTTQFIEKYCDFNSVKTSKYFLTYMLKDVLSIVNECTRSFHSIFDPEYSIRNVNIFEDIIVPVYNGNEKRIPNLMKYIYSPFIEYQKNIMKYIPEFVNLQLEILEVKNIIEKYVMNKRIIFKTDKKLEMLKSSEPYDKLIMNRLLNICLNFSQFCTLTETILEILKDIPEQQEFIKNNWNVNVSINKYKILKEKITIYRPDEALMNSCFHYNVGEPQKNEQNITIELTLLINPIVFYGSIKDFILEHNNI